jgi:hypothetical protein
MKKKPIKKKKSLQNFFDSFEDKVFLAHRHDQRIENNPRKYIKDFKKRFGIEPKPSLYHPVVIKWSENGRGFGEYCFWMEEDGIHCDNECDSREVVKRVLCRMVDQAIFQDQIPKN